MKKNLFSSLMLASLSVLPLSAFAKKDCTTEPKEKWMSEADFKKKVESEGYTIKKFKIEGNCYEIYGVNKEGKKVEIYFNPIDGIPAKKK